MFRISVKTLLITGIAVTALSFIFGGTVVSIFAKDNANVSAIAIHGFAIVATSFIMMAYNVFASGWFSALNLRFSESRPVRLFPFTDSRNSA